jgi:hypothetical protein
MVPLAIRNCRAIFRRTGHPPLNLLATTLDPFTGIQMRRHFAILLTAGLLLVGSLALTSGAAAATIAPTTTCSNGVDNTGGLGLICEVTVVNTITASGGSATVTVRECHGAAGNPQAACSVTTKVLTAPVTAVTQCNSSINGGGGTLRCSVQVTNNFVGLSAGATAATVNQCVGSGGGITIGCVPFPATTSGATITQCNGSANGGTLVGLTCTATGTKASAHGVNINQCNGSANGGGALVICSANINNNVLAATASPAASPGTGGSTAAPSIPNSATQANTDNHASGLFPVIFIGVLLFAPGLVVSRKTGSRRS